MLEVFRGWSRCGRDANGGFLLSELRELLEKEGIDDPGEQDAWEQLFQQIEAELVLVRDERAAEREAELSLGR